MITHGNAGTGAASDRETPDLPLLTPGTTTVKGRLPEATSRASWGSTAHRPAVEAAMASLRAHGTTWKAVREWALAGGTAPCDAPPCTINPRVVTRWAEAVQDGRTWLDADAAWHVTRHAAA